MKSAIKRTIENYESQKILRVFVFLRFDFASHRRRKSANGYDYTKFDTAGEFSLANSFLAVSLQIEAVAFSPPELPVTGY